MLSWSVAARTFSPTGDLSLSLPGVERRTERRENTNSLDHKLGDWPSLSNWTTENIKFSQNIFSLASFLINDIEMCIRNRTRPPITKFGVLISFRCWCLVFTREPARATGLVFNYFLVYSVLSFLEEEECYVATITIIYSQHSKQYNLTDEVFYIPNCNSCNGDSLLSHWLSLQK